MSQLKMSSKAPTTMMKNLIKREGLSLLLQVRMNIRKMPLFQRTPRVKWATSLHKWIENLSSLLLFKVPKTMLLQIEQEEMYQSLQIKI